MWHWNDFISQVLYVHLCCCLNYWSQSNHLQSWSHSLVWYLRLFLGWCCFVQECFCCCYCFFFSSVDNCPVEAISLKSSRVGERKYLLLQSKSIIIEIIIIIALERWCCNAMALLIILTFMIMSSCCYPKTDWNY